MIFVESFVCVCVPVHASIDFGGRLLYFKSEMEVFYR